MKILKNTCVFALAIILIWTAVPCQMQAASKPVFQSKRDYIYENSKTTNWIYTLKNVSKGQTVKWSLSGSGKKFVKLKFTTPRRVTGSTISNAVTLNTNGDSSAKNKKVTVIAKVYNKKGKLITTTKTSSNIRILSTDLTIEDSESGNTTYYTGSSYTFTPTLFPSNSTDTVQWSITDSLGTDVSSYISSTGVFTPLKAGNYTLKATSYSGNSRRCTAKKEIQVKDAVSAISQTGLNTFKVQVPAELVYKLTAESFTIKGSNGTTYGIKSVSAGTDNYINVTTYNNFSNGISYTVTFDSYSRTFTASTGLPTHIELLTTQVVANKPTQIKYALYDQNGVDVTTYYRGSLSFQSTLSDVIISTDYKLTMKQVNTATNLTVTFMPVDSYVRQLVGSGTVVCVANQTAESSNFTITNSSSAPNYNLTNYSDNRKITVGTTSYAHFRALDKNGDVITYDKIEYYSDKENSLIIDRNSGKITAIKNDTVTITVRTISNGVEQYNPYTVTIADAAYLNDITLDRYYITMSNVYNSSYVEYINVSATDQAGYTYPLDNETVTFSGPSSPKVTYNKATDQIAISASGALAGDYSYVASITSGTKTLTATFYVKVVNTAAYGSTSYSLELSNKTVDVSVNKDTSSSDKYVTLKLARKLDDVFSNYATFNVLSITKDGKYYSSNLTNSAQTNAPSYSNTSQLSLLVSAMSSTTSGYYTCKAAEAGTYTVNVSYYRSDNNQLCYDSVDLTVIDSDNAPTATIGQITSNKTCSTALQLAQSCILLDRGTIVDCTVIGTTLSGSKYSIESQKQYHISSVTVETSTLISNGFYVTKQYSVPINQTFTNN